MQSKNLTNKKKTKKNKKEANHSCGDILTCSKLHPSCHDTLS